MRVPEAVENARAAHIMAAESLRREVVKAYPVGVIVRVRLGKGWVEGEVLGHASSWWYQPDTVRFRNDKTGKLRKFQAGSTPALVAFRPKKSEVQS